MYFSLNEIFAGDGDFFPMQGRQTALTVLIIIFDALPCHHCTQLFLKSSFNISFQDHQEWVPE